MRLGDLDAMLEKWENDPSNCGYDPNFHAVKALIKNAPTIDPETLPVVQMYKGFAKSLSEENKKLNVDLDRVRQSEGKLYRELEKVKAERDAAVNDCSGRCDTCAFEKDCAKHDANDADIMHWYYGDCEDWEWRGVKED